MDRTDLAIFTRIVSGPLLTDERLGREVGLTGKAVRLRRRRLEAAGVVTEYGVYPAPELLARHAMTWRYSGKEWPKSPVSGLAEIDDLVYVMHFRPALSLVVRFTTESNPTPDPRLARMLGPPVDERPDAQPSGSSIPADRFSRTDWRVLEAAVRTPRASYAARARPANLSPRTFRIHQARLEAGHALRCAMILDLEREAGLATYGIWLKVDRSFDGKAIEQLHLWDRPHWTQHPPGVYLLGSAETYFAAREVELQLRSMRGVIGADPLIPAGGYFARERLVGWIRKERERRYPSGPLANA
jgi:DNA-binding Lrp family transcriptional regulator